MLKKTFYMRKKVLIKIMISNSFTALKGSGKKCINLRRAAERLHFRGKRWNFHMEKNKLKFKS